MEQLTLTPLLHDIASCACHIAQGTQSCLYIDRLDRAIGQADAPTAPHTIYVRDLVQLAFEKLGFEIAFSGKGGNEKGVIIDADETRLLQLGLKPASIKFGQTVVRAGGMDESHIALKNPLSTKGQAGASYTELADAIVQLVERQLTD